MQRKVARQGLRLMRIELFQHPAGVFAEKSLNGAQADMARCADTQTTLVDTHGKSAPVTAQLIADDAPGQQNVLRLECCVRR